MGVSRVMDNTAGLPNGVVAVLTAVEQLLLVVMSFTHLLLNTDAKTRNYDPFDPNIFGCQVNAISNLLAPSVLKENADLPYLWKLAGELQQFCDTGELQRFCNEQTPRPALNLDVETNEEWQELLNMPDDDLHALNMPIGDM